jgi:nucleotide-binding universal stress UspA family protein
MASIENIVVGVDGSDNSRKALEWAYEEAAQHGAALTVVTTWHTPSLPLYGSVAPDNYPDQPRREALELLDRFTAALVPKDPTVDVRTSVEEGKNPAQVLIERSREAQLVVVGARGRDGFIGMLLGSVPQHVVAHAQCPVVIVR